MKLNRKMSVFLASALLTTTSQQLMSQESMQYERGLKIGGFVLEPEFGFGLRHNDNIFTTPSNEVDSWIAGQQLNLVLFIEPAGSRIELEYDGDYAQYLDSRDDDYNDHEIVARALVPTGRKGLFNVETAFDSAHQNRGSGLSLGIDPESAIFPDSPDLYDEFRVLGEFSYGSQGAPARLGFEAGYRGLEFQNNLERTRFFDRERVYIGGSFFYRVAPRTSAVFDVRYEDISYPESRPGQFKLDSEEYRLQLGLTWEGTAKTTGVAKVGYLIKDFSDETLEDFSEPSWYVDIRWSPRTYSYFELKSALEAIEAIDLFTEFIRRRRISLSWTHDWSRGWESFLELSYRDDDHRGSPRQEDLSRFRLMMSYKMRRWLAWEFGANIGSQKSTLEQFEFDQVIFLVGARITL